MKALFSLRALFLVVVALCVTPATAFADDAPAPVPAPVVATPGQYAHIALANPLRASKSAGTVAVTLAPAGVPAATGPVVVDVDTLGFNTFSRVVTADTTVVLPRPYWLLSTQVKVTIGLASNPSTGFSETRGYQAIYY